MSKIKKPTKKEIKRMARLSAGCGFSRAVAGKLLKIYGGLV